MLPKKILFIDDDIDLHHIIKVIFEDDGIECNTALQTCPITDIPSINPNLILLDEWLPNKNGSEFCQELKKECKTCDIPVILISAVNGLENIAQKCHADAYINKPFDIDNLRQVVKRYL